MQEQIKQPIMIEEDIPEEELLIDARHISVRYRVGNFSDVGLKDYVINKITGREKTIGYEAVKDVSFKLGRGEFLGIIGRNGAGKTTLLKAVTGVIDPPRDKKDPEKNYIRTKGHISSLLALGTGFVGTMTIKENVYLRGALLGYSKKFLDEKYPEILEFSELEEFENFQLRQLSSGMGSRLAFSIASLIDPEILILDEVLAVGDGSFYAKSLPKMLEIINGGAGTIMVSHSLPLIRKMSTKVLWLEKGECRGYGDTKAVCDEYEAFLKSLKK